MSDPGYIPNPTWPSDGQYWRPLSTTELIPLNHWLNWLRITGRNSGFLSTAWESTSLPKKWLMKKEEEELEKREAGRQRAKEIYCWLLCGNWKLYSKLFVHTLSTSPVFNKYDCYEWFPKSNEPEARGRESFPEKLAWWTAAAILVAAEGAWHRVKEEPSNRP